MVAFAEVVVAQGQSDPDTLVDSSLNPCTILHRGTHFWETSGEGNPRTATSQSRVNSTHGGRTPAQPCAHASLSVVHRPGTVLPCKHVPKHIPATAV